MKANVIYLGQRSVTIELDNNLPYYSDELYDVYVNSEKYAEKVQLNVFSIYNLELATKYIPLPGASGMAEISFSALFASLFSDGTLFWAMLFWRIMNYFIYLLQGIIVLIYDFAYGNKKNRLNLIKLAQKDKEIMELTKSQINKKTRKSTK